MNTANLKVVITPSGAKEAHHGCVYSNENEINVNMIDNSYVILFTDEDFMKIHPVTTLSNIKNIMENNLPSCDIIFTLIYDVFDANDHQYIDQKTLMGLLKIDDKLSFNPEMFKPLLYNPSDQLASIANLLLSESPKKEEKEEPNAKDDTDEYEYMLRALYGDNILSTSHNRKKKNKKNKSKINRNNYTSSRVMKAASHPKRDFNRHGIIICGNKKAIKKDEEIIKDFLKDFIPGNSSFRKDIRKKLTKRWISLFVITKKEANHINKKYKRSINRVAKQQRADHIVDFTKKLLSVPVDSWNDPNR